MNDNTNQTNEPNFPTIIFDYPTRSNIMGICNKFKDTPIDVLKKAMLSYSSIANPKNDKIHLVPIQEILYDDIKYNKTYMKLYYIYLARYGEEFLDTIIAKDMDGIRNKIIDVINFMFDKVYKTDIIEVSIIEKKKEIFSSLYPILIYSTIHQNFIIKKQYKDKYYNIIIQKRSNV